MNHMKSLSRNALLLSSNKSKGIEPPCKPIDLEKKKMDRHWPNGGRIMRSDSHMNLKSKQKV